MAPTPLATALGQVVAELPGGGEARPGQLQMAEAIDTAIKHGRHLAVQAGTGTGKSLAYLVPAIRSGRRTVVATATKALQDQLATRDLPFLEEHLEVPFSWAVMKGRSNYVCLQRAREVMAGDQQAALELNDVAPALREEIRRIVTWSGGSDFGDRADLPWEPSPRAWSAVSVSSQDCPGASRCPLGEACFAESVRKKAATADLIVVNTHLYGLHLASGGALLPDHDVVIVDEAHQLEEIVSATCGVELGATRFASVSRAARAVIADDVLVAEIAGVGTLLNEILGAHLDERLTDLPDDITGALTLARSRLESLANALRKIESDIGDTQQRKLRAQRGVTAVMEDIDAALSIRESDVRWVEGSPQNALLRVAPIDVADVLKTGLWTRHSVVLTSATLAAATPARLGLTGDPATVLDVGSPFDYEHNALLYCAVDLPDPRDARYRAALHDELHALITAAQGRTLALFTSWNAMRAAAEALTPRLPYRVFTQSELPKAKLLAAFASEESSCLFATAGLFQGIDVPGSSLSLVTIDRLPFARPDEPLLQARRERAGADAFMTIDVPRAATLLAQAAGRLIRSATDRGVVAVLDKRLAKASYRWDIVNALPPMKRTRHRDEVEAFLAEL
ncbi:MAG: ATP-dependent DNA helicase [Acidimicrobiia bacterium]